MRMKTARGQEVNSVGEREEGPSMEPRLSFITTASSFSEPMDKAASEVNENSLMTLYRRITPSLSSPISLRSQASRRLLPTSTTTSSCSLTTRPPTLPRQCTGQFFVFQTSTRTRYRRLSSRRRGANTSGLRSSGQRGCSTRGFPAETDVVGRFSYILLATIATTPRILSTTSVLPALIA